MEWPEYLELVQKMKREAKSLRGTLSKREKIKLQDYLVVLLYSFYPLRNDFGDVRVVTPAKYKKLEAGNQLNYLVDGPKDMTLILQEYKTAGTYGTKTIEMNATVKPSS